MFLSGLYLLQSLTVFMQISHATFWRMFIYDPGFAGDVGLRVWTGFLVGFLLVFGVGAVVLSGLKRVLQSPGARPFVFLATAFIHLLQAVLDPLDGINFRMKIPQILDWAKSSLPFWRGWRRQFSPS